MCGWVDAADRFPPVSILVILCRGIHRRGLKCVVRRRRHVFCCRTWKFSWMFDTLSRLVVCRLILSPLLSRCKQDITKQVRGCKNRYFKIDKPPTCKLDEGTYRLTSEPEGEIKPQVWLSCICFYKHRSFSASFCYVLPIIVSLCRIWNSPWRWPRWRATSRRSSRSLLPLNCLS